MAEEYNGILKISKLDDDFREFCFTPRPDLQNVVRDIGENHAKCLEIYIKKMLRYPFNHKPYAHIAAWFLVLEVYHDGSRTEVNMKLTGNPRYPKWVSKIFLKGE